MTLHKQSTCMHICGAWRISVTPLCSEALLQVWELKKISAIQIVLVIVAFWPFIAATECYWQGVAETIKLSRYAFDLKYRRYSFCYRWRQETRRHVTFLVQQHEIHSRLPLIMEQRYQIKTVVGNAHLVECKTKTQKPRPQIMLPNRISINSRRRYGSSGKVAFSRFERINGSLIFRN